jgi:hypothetical protein
VYRAVIMLRAVVMLMIVYRALIMLTAVVMLMAVCVGLL